METKPHIQDTYQKNNKSHLRPKLILIHNVVALILHNRITTTKEPLLRKNQARFRVDRSCVDNTNTLRIKNEQVNEWNEELYLEFIYFQTAFDSIHITHNSLLKLMQTF